MKTKTIFVMAILALTFVMTLGTTQAFAGGGNNQVNAVSNTNSGGGANEHDHFVLSSTGEPQNGHLLAVSNIHTGGGDNTHQLLNTHGGG